MSGKYLAGIRNAAVCLACVVSLAAGQTVPGAAANIGTQSSGAQARQPLVVFISGFGVDAASWQPLEAQLAGQVETFAFERPGYGGTPLAASDADGVRTADEVVALLDDALRGRNVQGPVVLVAHSLGGQYALRYAKLRPDSVAALVLVDARMKGYTARCSAVASSCTPPPIAADTAKHLAAEVRGMPAIESGMPESEELRSIPVTVIVRTKGPQPQLAVWQESQSAFARKLNKGKLVVAPDSGHFIQKDQLGLVVAEIVAAVKLARTNL